MKNAAFLITLLIIVSCTTPPPTAQEIVDQAIKASGTTPLQNGSATFVFRKIQYEYERKNGSYTYTRIQKDSTGIEVKDELTNDGLVRFIAGKEAEITEKKRTAYTSSVNSVIYFAFLPLWLNDAAVNKSYDGIIEIKGTKYHKIKVTFNQEGGGEDFEDVFYYWFDTEDFSMDYIAYSYNEEDEGVGMRFRVAFNARKVNGVIIQDYENLKPKVKDSYSVDQLDEAYIKGDLKELSLIELENMNITLN
jgi:hypothetical protein